MIKWIIYAAIGGIASKQLQSDLWEINVTERFIDKIERR